MHVHFIYTNLARLLAPCIYYCLYSCYVPLRHVAQALPLLPTGTGAPTGTAARSCSELSGPFNSAAEQPSRVPTVKILHARLRENVQRVCAATFVDDADHPPNSARVGSTTI